jgi:cell division protein FtsQ
VTGASGIIGDGGVSPDEAAGDSPTSGARTRHRRRGWRAAFFALAAVGVVGAAAWTLFGSPLLVVRSVTVSGTHLVPRSEVLAVSGVQLGTPLIRVNTAQAAARIVQIRQVRSARVTRSWPDRLTIVVRERTPELGVTAAGGGYDLVDADGVVVRWAARDPAGLPLYATSAPADALRGDADLSAAAAVLGELPAAVRHAVRSVSAPEPDQVTLHLAGGTTVLWGDPGRAAVKARELTVLMRSHMRYYDVSGLGSVAARLLADAQDPPIRDTLTGSRVVS